MKVLFLGDVVGTPGRDVIRRFVPELRESEKLDCVIANGENAAAGKGVDEKTSQDLFASGVDLLTGGNHTWDKKEVVDYFAKERRVIRPANFPDAPGFPCPGKGHIVLEGSGGRLGVLNLMGRVHMDPLDDPFAVGSRWIDWFDDHGVQCILVDFHAEATSEKQAFLHYVAGRVSAVVGTHTHVQTADERLVMGLQGGKTAYITDAGMNGPYDSVIGMKKEKSVHRFLTKLPQRYEPAEGQPGLHGVIIEINNSTGAAQSIKRISKFI